MSCRRRGRLYSLLTTHYLLIFRGQAIVEYAVLIGIAATALVVMQTYIKRGVQAGIKVAADQIGDQRRGIVEPERNRIWIVKEESQVTTNTPPSTWSRERRLDGVTVYRSAQVASGSRNQSFSLSAERNQQEQ